MGMGEGRVGSGASLDPFSTPEVRLQAPAPAAARMAQSWASYCVLLPPLRALLPLMVPMGSTHRGQWGNPLIAGWNLSPLLSGKVPVCTSQ